jgi:L-amino acid N-acyltransferase YncA
VTLIIRNVIEDDWDQVKMIYLEGIATGNATFQTEAPPKDQWFNNHVLECSFVCILDNTLVGWAAISKVSTRSVYSGVAEVSVYISQSVRGKGIGYSLLHKLIEFSELNGFWTLQAGIFPENEASLKLHYKNGFREVGRRVRLGKMNDVWRDVILLERRSEIIGRE